MVQMQTKKWPDRAPLKSLDFIVSDSARDDFFIALKMLAKENDFSFRAVQINPTKKEIFVDIIRKDIEIFGNNLRQIDLFHLCIYAAPDGSFSSSAVEEIFNKLRFRISSVPGVVIKSAQ